MEATEEEIQESFAGEEGDRANETENSQSISLDG
jgi:hypothetical protein